MFHSLKCQHVKVKGLLSCTNKLLLSSLQGETDSGAFVTPVLTCSREMYDYSLRVLTGTNEAHEPCCYRIVTAPTSDVIQHKIPHRKAPAIKPRTLLL